MSLTKRIEDLVYSGKVMDDHGNWISIAKQLQKEKRFLRHLEQGEILINGTWIAMSDLKKTTSSPPKEAPPSTDKPTVNKETTLVSPMGYPEETVFLSTETIVDVLAKQQQQPSKHDPDTHIRSPEGSASLPRNANRNTASAAPENSAGINPDFPPETESLFFEPADTADDTSPSPEPQQDDVATDFQETVLYRINTLKNTPTPSIGKEPSPSRQSAQDNRKPIPAVTPQLRPEQSRHPSGFNGSLFVVIAIIIVVLIVLIRVFM